MTYPARTWILAAVLSACAAAPSDERPGSAVAPGPGQDERNPGDEGSEPSAPEPDASEPEPSCLDTDGDGYGPGCEAGDDCAPLDPLAYSDAGEVCGDLHDNDCDGLVDEGCPCDAAQTSCPVDAPPLAQTLGELMFDMSRGFMALDTVCGDARVQTLDGEREAIVTNIDALVTTANAVTVGEVAREVLEPLIQSGDLESASHALINGTALLVDDGFDPERRTLAALAELLESDSLLDARHVLAIAEGMLTDERVPQLVHAVSELGAIADGNRAATNAFLSVVSAGLSATSETQMCAGLSLDGLGKRLLEVRDLPNRTELGRPAWVVDVNKRDQSFDAKQTGLAVGLTLARDALAAGVHRDLTVVLDAALGQQVACGADCQSYPREDHPLSDLTFVATDLLRYDETRALLEALSVLLPEQPQVAESLLLATGKFFERARAADVSLDGAQVLRLTRDLLPLLARIFESNGETPRLLLKAMHDLGSTARDFPERLRFTIDYAKLEKARTCSSSPPNLARSQPVDYAQPRGNNNRSSLEQVIELLAAVDCGKVPFSGGKSVGVFVLDTVAGMTPSTVCGVTDVLLGALDVTGVVGDFFTKAALRTIGCRDADRVLRELDSLEDLAESGALDFLIPLDKVFADRGQLRTLMAIFSIVAEDLARDDDRDPKTNSVFRPLLPVLSALIAEGTADALFDLLDVLVTVETRDARGQPATLADVLIDATAFVLTEHTVPTRQGVVTGKSHLSVLLEASERVVARLDGAHVSAATVHLTDHLSGYLKTGADGRLAHGELVPLGRALLDGVVDVWTLPRAQRDCYVDGWMKDSEALATSETLATTMRLLRLYTQSEQGALMDALAVDWLAPVGSATTPSVFTPLLQVTAELVSLPPPSAPLRELTPYLSKVSDPAWLDGPAILHTVDTLLQQDDERVFIGILQKAIDQRPDGLGRARVLDLLEAYTRVLAITPNACSADYRPWSPRGLDGAVQTTLGFMRDPTYGVDALFDALRELVATP